MQVRDVMTRGVECVEATATVQEAAARMRDLDVGPLPVVEGGRLVGMITDRDIAVRSTAAGQDPTRATVGAVMTRETITCSEDDDVAEAGRIMKDKQVRRLLVLNRDGGLAGIVALGDLAVDTGDERVAGNTLEGVSQPSEPRR